MKKLFLFLIIFVGILIKNIYSQIDFDYTYPRPCAKEDYEFTPSGLNSPDSVVWDWGDGQTTAVLSSPYSATHRFSNADVYTVTLKEYSGGAVVAQKSKNVVVYDKPNLTLEYQAASIVCAPNDSIILIIDSVNLEDPQLQMTIMWGDNTQNSGTYDNLGDSYIHYYTTTSCGNEINIGGTVINDKFLITVVATNRCTDVPEVFFRTVDIKSKPDVGIGFADSTDITYDEATHTYYLCTEGEQTLTNSSYDENNCLAITDVLWEVYDNQGNLVDQCNGCEQEYTFNFGDYGVYNIKLTQNNACGLGTVERTIILRQPPYVAFEFEEPIYCYPSKATFINTSGDSVLYFWWDFIGDSSNIVVDTGFVDPPHTYAYTEEGEYNIILKGFDGYCYNTYDTTLELFQRCQDIYVPNAFIPDDPNPDINRFRPKAQNLVEYKLEIYDLNGQFLWSSDKLDENGSPLEGWDGTCNGVKCPQGTYIWKIYAVIDEGEFGQRIWDGQVYNKKGKRSITGTFLLIR